MHLGTFYLSIILLDLYLSFFALGLHIALLCPLWVLMISCVIASNVHILPEFDSTFVAFFVLLLPLINCSLFPGRLCGFSYMFFPVYIWATLSFLPMASWVYTVFIVCYIDDFR